METQNAPGRVPSLGPDRSSVRMAPTRNRCPTRTGGNCPATPCTTQAAAPRPARADWRSPTRGIWPGDRPWAGKPLTQRPFQTACQSPPFLVETRYRQVCPGHPRNLVYASIHPSIPAGRSIRLPFPSWDLFPADPSHQSLASVCSFLSRCTSRLAASLLLRIICPISQPRSAASTGHLALRMKNMSLSTPLKDS